MFVCVLICRQLLLCRVTLGKSFLQFSAMKMAHAPPGHHSVIGRPSIGGLTFAEYVVYRGEQVRVHLHTCMDYRYGHTSVHDNCVRHHVDPTLEDCESLAVYMGKLNISILYMPRLPFSSKGNYLPNLRYLVKLYLKNAKKEI